MSRAETSRSNIAGQKTKVTGCRCLLLTGSTSSGRDNSRRHPFCARGQGATATIPIVFEVAVDPVELRLVASLKLPGANITGVTNLNVETGPKKLQLLRELLPTATIIAVLVDPTSPSLTEQFLRGMRAAAPTLGLQLQILNASTERDFDTVFATFAQLRAAALVIGPNYSSLRMSNSLPHWRSATRCPRSSNIARSSPAGGLMGYGANETDNYRLRRDLYRESSQG